MHFCHLHLNIQCQVVDVTGAEAAIAVSLHLTVASGHLQPHFYRPRVRTDSALSEVVCFKEVKVLKTPAGPQPHIWMRMSR
jgi:hypothetical protein